MCEERELIAHVKRLELSGIQERYGQRYVHSFVTISVDGEQQVQTQRSVNTLTPNWNFSEPLTMMVRASSIIKFNVYREHAILSKIGNNIHYCGEVEMELQAVLTNSETPFKLQSPWYSREENLRLCVHIDIEPTFRHDSLLDYAQGNSQWAGSRRDAVAANKTINLIGRAVENLDQVVSIVDGLVEIHPMCKVAWMVLGSVYKAFKNEHVLDHQANDLAQELKETLAYAKECKDLKAIPEATDVLFEIAKLVVQSAAAFDAEMKYSITTQPVTSAARKTNHNRISDCETRLNDLRKKLQETLIIRTFHTRNTVLANSKHNLFCSFQDADIISSGLANNGLCRSLPSIYKMSPATHLMQYIPSQGRHRPGYSPIYLSAPLDEDCCPVPWPSPIMPFFNPRKDGPYHFSFSPETADTLGFGNSPVLPLFTPYAMLSHISSFSIDSGCTLSGRSAYSGGGENGEDGNSLFKFDCGSYSIQLSLTYSYTSASPGMYGLPET